MQKAKALCERRMPDRLNKHAAPMEFDDVLARQCINMARR